VVLALIVSFVAFVVIRFLDVLQDMDSTGHHADAIIHALIESLAELAKAQSTMDSIRAKEKAVYDKAHAETSKGLDGIQKALNVLSDYYAGKDSGAGEGIIGMLEVIESDFTKSLTEMTTTEETAAMAYKKWMKETAITKTTKESDVKFKTKEAASLDKAVSELTTDKDGVQTELDAVLEYLGKLTEKCVAKPEPYAERKAKREAEIAGLKQALQILEGEAVLLQKTAKHTLRGARHA